MTNKIAESKLAQDRVAEPLSITETKSPDGIFWIVHAM